MLKPIFTKQFAKDIKKTQKRGKDLDKFKIIARTLVRSEELDAIHRDHKLLGTYTGRRECHIESNWLLIYKSLEDSIIFERMGSHADLFKK